MPSVCDYSPGPVQLFVIYYSIPFRPQMLSSHGSVPHPSVYNEHPTSVSSPSLFPLPRFTFLHIIYHHHMYDCHMFRRVADTEEALYVDNEHGLT